VGDFPRQPEIRRTSESVLNRIRDPLRLLMAERPRAAAANAIMGLPDEWEEVVHENEPLGHHFSNHCGQPSYLTGDPEEGIEFRLFLRRHPAPDGVSADSSRQRP